MTAPGSATGVAGRSWAAQREHGARWLVRLMIWIAIRLGWRVGHALLVPITLYFMVAAGPARRASRDYLARILGRPARPGERWRHLFGFASTILDRVFLLSGRLAGFEIAVEGLDALLATVAEGRGCVLLGAHFGSFDVLRAIGRESPVPVRPLMYRANLGATTTHLLEALDPALAAAVIEVGRPDTMLRVREALARGEMVGMLADRAPAGERLMERPFLGAPAPFPTGPFVLAALARAPVMLFQGIRLGPRRYLVRFEPFAERIALRRGARETDLAHWVDRYVVALEAACRAHPFNWFNLYSFWGPPGAAHPAAKGARWRVAAPLALLAVLPVGAAAPPWLAGLMVRMAAIGERHDRFREEKRLAALDRPLLSEGELVWRRPAHLEKLTTGPVPERLVVDGDRLSVSGAGTGAREVSLQARPEVAALVDAVRGTLAGDLAVLGRTYQVTAEGDAAGWRLRLVPLGADVRRLLRSITLRGAETEVRGIETMLANGDIQVMTIGPVS